ncbi:MAG TPA: dihydroorotate dehydrogenase electron transfer subunit [Planctomycetota bacterium]|nr:dihydroorotate dehydrogenase electron transfer subunit [Planctomycetota bacterium]
MKRPGDVHGTVISNERIAPDAFVLRYSDPAPAFRPGEFIQVAAWDSSDPLLRRPMSVLDQGDGWASFLYQVTGRGTRIFASLRPGDRVKALGPLGNSFSEPPRDGVALVVAGGVGVAPFLMLVRELVKAGRETVVLLGARDASRLYLERDLEREGARVLCATENGERGTKGFVTALLEAEIARRGPRGIARLYSCGPEPMLRAVHTIARARGVPGEASLERRMACGFGVCFTCVCPILDPKTGVTRNRRTCLDGPVIDLERLPAGF